MIYFIRSSTMDDSPIKIGYSASPLQRLIALQTDTATWDRIWLSCTIRGDRTRESQIHKQFAHLRARGEWFWPTDELERFIVKEGEKDLEYFHEYLNRNQDLVDYYYSLPARLYVRDRVA